MNFATCVLAAVVVQTAVFLSKGKVIRGFICNNDNDTIACHDSKVIEVLMARFGRNLEDDNCKNRNHIVNATCFDDVLDKIEMQCNNTESCVLSARGKNLKGYCPKVKNRYLEVQYQCIPKKDIKNTDQSTSTRSSPTTAENAMQLWVYIVVAVAIFLIVMLLIALICLRKKSCKWSTKKTMSQDGDEHRQQLTNNNISSRSESPATKSVAKCIVKNELYIPLEATENHKKEQAAYALAVDPVEGPYSVIGNDGNDTSDYSVIGPH